MIRVLIVDDHRVVRLGLEALLEETEDIELVGSAADGDEACRLASVLNPDVVLMDLTMPKMDGVEATRQIMANNPGTSIVVLTSFSDRERVLAALDAGATGYQLKDADTETLLKGIRTAAAGHAPLDPRVASAVLASRSQNVATTPQLTVREEEVLNLVGGGMLNKQIARKLGISESTVKSHLTRVFQTIGVQDRTQAALWVQRRNNAATGSAVS
jgi:DNA-binding NarL/FixJ family response regulator